jgi:UDP-N-acetylglucosamine 4-epimerase
VAVGGRISLLELVGTLQRLLKTNVEPIFGAAREGDVRDSQADIVKARQKLGFDPQTSLEDGLRETVKWYQASVLGATSGR